MAAAVTQQEADLAHWVRIRNGARTWPLWRLAQGRVDAIFRAMGYEQAALSALADEELIFPAVRAVFENAASGIGQ